MKISKLFLGLAVLHFILSWGLFLYSYTLFPRPGFWTPLRRLASSVSDVLMWPLIPFAQWVGPQMLPGLLGYVLFFGNSLLWGFAMWLVLRRWLPRA